MGKQRLSYLPKVTLLLSGGANIQIQAYLIINPVHLTISKSLNGAKELSRNVLEVYTAHSNMWEHKHWILPLKKKNWIRLMGGK